MNGGCYEAVVPPTTVATPAAATTASAGLGRGRKKRSASARLLQHLFTFPGSNSLDQCLNTCSGKGHKYAGLQAGTECYCGDEPPPGEKLKPESECDAPCPGDSSQKCGGADRLQVYMTRHAGWNDRLDTVINYFDTKHRCFLQMVVICLPADFIWNKRTQSLLS